MFRGAITIWRRDLLVLRRSLFSEFLAVIAYPLTLYLAFGIGLRGYIADVDGIPYSVFIAPGLISMTAVNSAFNEPFRFPPFHLLLYLLYIFLGSMIFSCVGTMCGTTIDKPENIGRVEAVVIIPLIFMSGIFFPLSSYPPAILSIINLLPTTAIFEGARQSLLAGEPGIRYLSILLITAALIFALAVYTFNRKIEE